jgi:hypothetical protein
VLSEQALYHLSHTPSSFCFSYFSGRVSHFCPGLPSIPVFLPMSSVYLRLKVCATTPRLFVQMGSWVVLPNFLPGLALNCDPHNPHTLSSWDCRQATLPGPKLIFLTIDLPHPLCPNRCSPSQINIRPFYSTVFVTSCFSKIGSGISF